MSAFYGCEVVRLVADLAGYGPAPQPLGWSPALRTSRYLYQDYVKGLAPWPEGGEHRADQGPETTAIPTDAYRALLTEVVSAAGAAVPAPGAGRTALVLAESFVADGILSRDQETSVWREAVEAAVAADVDEVVVLADPVAAANLGTRLGAVETGGVRCTLIENPAPAEAYLGALRPVVVVGTMSPVLLRARADGVHVVPVGAKLVKEQLRPYANPARFSWAVADAVLREDGRWSDSGDLGALLQAVTFCMYPDRFPERRADVIAFLEALEPAEVGRYTTANRAQKLGLLPVPRPEAEPEPEPTPTAGPRTPGTPAGWFRGLVRGPF